LQPTKKKLKYLRKSKQRKNNQATKLLNHQLEKQTQIERQEKMKEKKKKLTLICCC
jgi:hypothetical protein